MKRSCEKEGDFIPKKEKKEKKEKTERKVSDSNFVAPDRVLTNATEVSDDPRFHNMNNKRNGLNKKFFSLEGIGEFLREGMSIEDVCSNIHYGYVFGAINSERYWDCRFTVKNTIKPNDHQSELIFESLSAKESLIAGREKDFRPPEYLRLVDYGNHHYSYLCNTSNDRNAHLLGNCMVQSKHEQSLFNPLSSGATMPFTFNNLGTTSAISCLSCIPPMNHHLYSTVGVGHRLLDPGTPNFCLGNSVISGTPSTIVSIPVRTSFSTANIPSANNSFSNIQSLPPSTVTRPNSRSLLKRTADEMRCASALSDMSSGFGSNPGTPAARVFNSSNPDSPASRVFNINNPSSPLDFTAISSSITSSSS